MMLDSDTAGQWCCDLRAAACMLKCFHASNTDELAERLAEMAETIADQ